jgi:hypothetical protein
MLVILLIGIGIINAAGRGGHATPESWYAAGKAFGVAVDQKDSTVLIGPVSTLAKVCTEYLDAATPVVPGQRPSATDQAADRQWLRGCEAGYYQDHPHELVEDGMMYPPGTRPCTAQCASNWYAAGKAVALAASTSSDPYLSPSSGGTPESAETWCADLLFPDPGQPLPASIEALIQANTPAPGPEAVEWGNGCEAGYNAAQNAAQSPAPVETETPAPVETETTPTAAATMNSTDYQALYKEAYQETATDYQDGQTPAVYHESDSEFCKATIETSLGNEEPIYAGCMAALSAQQ